MDQQPLRDDQTCQRSYGIHPASSRFRLSGRDQQRVLNYVLPHQQYAPALFVAAIKDLSGSGAVGRSQRNRVMPGRIIV